MQKELTVQELKNQLDTKLNEMKGCEVLNDSNYKFLVMLQTRLIESGLPLDHATQIAVFTQYDLSFVDEADDYIGDVALLYGEFCAKVYARLKGVNLHKHLDAPVLRKLFNPLGPIAP